MLAELNLSHPHPDVLLFEEEVKFGIAQAKEIIQFFNLKPYQKSKAVVLISAESATPEAQNALLKTLEEPAKSSIIILGVGAEDQLLPTVTSRCQVVPVQDKPEGYLNLQKTTITKLLQGNIEQRFKIIEGLEDKKALLTDLTYHFQKNLTEHPQVLPFLKDLIEAQKWAKQNVNLRAILEYLMLKMPRLG